MIDVNIKRVYNIFNELTNVSGTNAKKDILKKYEHDEYFKQVVNFLNFWLQYGSRKRRVVMSTKSKINKGKIHNRLLKTVWKMLKT